MDKAAVKLFRDRWKAVEMIKQRESSQRTLELRWKNLNMIYGLGQGLQLTSNHNGELRVHQRWAKLKEKM